jgi:hypothetical protein
MRCSSWLDSHRTFHPPTLAQLSQEPSKKLAVIFRAGQSPSPALLVLPTYSPASGVVFFLVAYVHRETEFSQQ